MKNMMFFIDRKSYVYDCFDMTKIFIEFAFFSNNFYPHDYLFWLIFNQL